MNIQPSSHPQNPTSHPQTDLRQVAQGPGVARVRRRGADGQDRHAHREPPRPVRGAPPLVGREPQLPGRYVCVLVCALMRVYNSKAVDDHVPTN